MTPAKPRRKKSKRRAQPQKPAASPARFYRRIGAEGWRNSSYFTYGSSSPAFRRWITAALGEAPLAILSIGCGNGELERHLAAAGHRPVGLDLSHPMLRRAARAGLRCPIEADARALPFAAASFDAVMFPESIGHLLLSEAFAEARRVLRRGGALIVTTYASHLGVHAQYRKYRFEELTPAAVAAGFALDEERFLAVKVNSVADAASDAKATLLYFKARAAAGPSAQSPSISP